MKLQTKVELTSPHFQIEAQHRVVIIGSCFATHLGEKLGYGFSRGDSWSEDSLFVNPNGVVYNPLSVARTLEIVSSGESFERSDLVEHCGLWHSMLFHSSFSAPTPESVLANINREAVKNVDIVVLTLGTSFVYFQDESAVANCHKLPEKEFLRRKLSVQEVVESLDRVARCYPDAKIVVTLSPIRHLRDGLSENSLSKATLRVAINEFCAAQSDSRYYFAAYEIVMDELRDYRFTEADMCHPTLQTRDYIWERFAEILVSKELKVRVEQGIKTAKLDAHRPLH